MKKNLSPWTDLHFSQRYTGEMANGPWYSRGTLEHKPQPCTFSDLYTRFSTQTVIFTKYWHFVFLEQHIEPWYVALHCCCTLVGQSEYSSEHFHVRAALICCICFVLQSLVTYLHVMMYSIALLANQNIPLSISNRCTSSGRSPKQLHKAFTAASILQKTNNNTILHQKYTRHVLKVSSAVVITYKAFLRIHAALQQWNSKTSSQP